MQAAVCWYPAINVVETETVQMDLNGDAVKGYPDPNEAVNEQTVPFMLLHGTGDTIVPCSRSEELYRTLTEHNVPVEYYLIEGAEHNSPAFVQPHIKSCIVEFLNRHLSASAK